MVTTTNEVAKVKLITGFADALRQSVAERHGGRWFCAASTMVTESSPLLTGSLNLVMLLRLRGAIHGELRIEIATRDAELLWEKLQPPGCDCHATWVEVLDGIVKHLPKRAGDTGMFAFSIESHELQRSASEGILIGRMELGVDGGAGVLLRVVVDQELMECLQVTPRTAFLADLKGRTNDGIASEFKRVIDVPLTVTLRFGERIMRLREVLELSTGTLVELDRQVEEPVDLILNEKVIARGEVVIVDGNYGLRVTEIVERNPAMLL
jgi:flagellar motor switch protein FliN/FliY